MEQQIEELSADILSKQIWYGLSELCSRFERLGLIIIKFPICRLISPYIIKQTRDIRTGPWPV